MNVLHRAFLRVFLIISIALVSMSLTQNARADAPKITVTPIWHPGTQLSTLDAGIPHQTDALGDDLRYVDLEIDVTTNVQFWAMELTCTVNKTALETYVAGSDPGATGDNTPIVTWGSAWTLTAAQVQQPFNPATGAMTIAAANAAGFPLGKNTITTSFPLATIRYRVKPVTTAMTSTLSCTGSFLNADGKPVLAPVFVTPPPLNIIPSYAISGNVSYQGRTTKSGIGVRCVGPLTYNATTDASGNFVIPTRIQGAYTCYYFGNTSVHAALAPDLYIQGSTQVGLNTLSYKILPVVLPGGNIDHIGAGTQTDVDISDLALVTFNYGVSTTAGDADGDGKTTKSDLAIVAGNYNLSEVYVASHILYGLTTGLVTNGSRIWVGRPALGKLTQQIPGTNVDNWPALSPNGAKIVVTRRLGTGPSYRYALFIMNSDGTGSATQLTPTTGPNGGYDAYAASWSPDGSQIAFNCASVPGSSWFFDDVSLCVMDAAGHSFRVLDTHVHIYPPAWLDNATLIYGSNSHSTVCPNFLCKVPVGGGNPAFYSAFPGAVSYIDMPSVSNGALFYRTLSGGFGSYRMADLDPAGNVSSAFPSAVAPYHVTFPLSGTIDYYAVRSGGRDFILASQGAAAYYSYTYNGAGGWNFIGVNTNPDQVNDPAWNATPESGSYVYTQRNSFAWVP